ncbi:uncharacterized protein LOC122529991 isoform X2 [Frieseomelitta varia]|uniref:uncharacterized protein LOC122529991 isoform X2 n=1 Tax=Frieseomelitta varia TaxID=561572 RepID=UPI001CB68906|nr:uncharacterized protein LOC122529991 isoform X2 [Frieseomelitta varia]
MSNPPLRITCATACAHVDGSLWRLSPACRTRGKKKRKDERIFISRGQAERCGLHPCYVPFYSSASSALTPRRNRRRGKKESVAWEGSFFVSLRQSRPPCTILLFS